MAERTTRTERRARRLASWSARPGPLGRWVERRLFTTAAVDGVPAARDAVVRVAETPGHRLRDRARRYVALWWAESRDPRLRETVLAARCVAPAVPERLVTLALLGELATGWEPEDADRARSLLSDDDPAVRENTAAFCRDASDPMLRTLWYVDTASGSPLQNALLANDTPPPQTVLDVLWADWLEKASQPLWDSLVRWGRPARGGQRQALSTIALGAEGVLMDPRLRRALIEAMSARFTTHPLRAIAERTFFDLDDRSLVEELCAAATDDGALAGFCEQHALAPEDPMRRVVFFLLTRQTDQVSALDPDGSMLSLAYLAADEADRKRIRDTMLAGELDLVRVIAGQDRRARLAEMSPDEMRYLARHLRTRERWAELWALARDLPLELGVEALRLCDGWAPSGDDERRLFEMYRETAPYMVKAAEQYLRDNWRVLVRQVRPLSGRVNDVSFAPGGTELAVAGASGAIGVFDLRTGEVVRRYDGLGSPVRSVLHTGDDALVAALRVGGDQLTGRVLLCADGSARELASVPRSVTSLAPVGTGGRFVAGTMCGKLLLGGLHGPMDEHPVTAFGLAEGDWTRALAAHRPSGRVAVLGRSLCLAEPENGWAVTVPAERQVVHAGFTDADTLVCADRRGVVTSWERLSTGWRKAALARFSPLAELGVLPVSGVPVAIERDGDLCLLDPATLAVTHRRPPPPSLERITGLVVSPKGEFVAVGDEAGHVTVLDVRLREVPDLLLRRQAGLVPRQLDAVGAALAEHRGGENVAKPLRLLHACLEHRFRFDVEIGAAVRLAPGDYEISL